MGNNKTENTKKQPNYRDYWKLWSLATTHTTKTGWL